MRYGTFTREELQSYIDHHEIRNVSITKTFKNGSQNFEAECKCDRCGGTGVYLNYGICFKCCGAGYVSCTGRIASEEQQKKAEEQTKARHEREFQKEQDVLAQTASEHPVENKMIAAWSTACGWQGHKVLGIEAETEKAYKVIVKNDNGIYFDCFIPKKALVEYEPPVQYPTDLYIKDWYLEKIISEDEEFRSFTITNESERAYFCNIIVYSKGFSEEYQIQQWIPKKCMETAEEHEASKQRDAMSSSDRYDALIAFAKANGVKGVRVGLRVRTILDKLEDLGLSYEY